MNRPCRTYPKDVLNNEQAKAMAEKLAEAGYVATRRGTIFPIPKRK